MSLTAHLPISEWYTSSDDYWRLDYPPGSAYQSLLSGLIVGAVDPASVGEPLASRGVEGPWGKVGMRLSVLVADLLVYLPACVLYWWVVCVKQGGEGTRDNARGTEQDDDRRRHDITNENKNMGYMTLFWLLINPALVLIDHGHFQYNGISLGCTILATVCVLQATRGRNIQNIQNHEKKQKDVSMVTPLTRSTASQPSTDRRERVTRSSVGAAFFFCMALNHKQMTLYYALAFFVFLLTESLCQDTMAGRVRMLGTLGLTVLGTFALLWAPFGMVGSRHIMNRIFPVDRGLYEDYVANFWCVSSLVYKWRVKWATGVLARLCMVATLGACVPILVLGALGVRRRRDVFVLMLAGVSLSFYLFSFQVHEKSILMPLVAVSMLGEERVTSRMQSVAMMTMYPLLKKDGLVVAYWAMQMLVAAVGGWDWPVHVTLALVHGVGAFVRVEGKPFLEDAVMMAAGFLYFVWVWIWLVRRLYAAVRSREGSQERRGDAKAKVA